MAKKIQGHQARKRFGQNFLHDENIIHRIIQSINPLETDNIIEIGPGLGAITRQILKRTGKIQVVELDRDIIPKLKIQCLNTGDLIIHQADALKFDFHSLLQQSQQPLRVIGNLPYNISTPLLFHLFDYIDDVADMHFMLQKEVVQRMAASPGNKQWGRLSIMVQYFCKIEMLFLVPPTAFNPAPRVESAIVRLIPHQQKPFIADNFSVFEQIVISAFGQRRKTLRNALKKWLTVEELQQLDINAVLRPEQLQLAEYVKIANFVNRKTTVPDNVDSKTP
ncbi:MAG TPA: 16S rRNA (adenine(1518)-N(6)/adenine(1519)-N(6))-dimethyltransferase RsmA [Aeromonadales bacterium]|nr:16S rRNA (adenine(1518)-N(6)/adenine(1519)-N(6))-dimethyltransferase RsmA [Aeromonadales bacterium]